MAERLTARTHSGSPDIMFSRFPTPRDLMIGYADLYIRLCDFEDLGTVEEFARQIQLEADARKLRPLDEWHEDFGDVLWWSLPIEEPPYCGSPLDCEFPNYVTHWTPLICPSFEIA